MADAEVTGYGEGLGGYWDTAQDIYESQEAAREFSRLAVEESTVQIFLRLCKEVDKQSVGVVLDIT